jgi:hypothetical protein
MGDLERREIEKALANRHNLKERMPIVSLKSSISYYHRQVSSWRL